jgi:uncharacterized membrane protein
MTNPTPQGGLSDNAIAAISYITFVPAVVFLVLDPYNKSRFVRFNAWQCIFLTIAAIIVSFALAIVLGIMAFFTLGLAHLLNFLVGLVWLLVWVLCIVQALNGKTFKLPIVGALADKQAGV